MSSQKNDIDSLDSLDKFRTNKGLSKLIAAQKAGMKTNVEATDESDSESEPSPTEASVGINDKPNVDTAVESTPGTPSGNSVETSTLAPPPPPIGVSEQESVVSLLDVSSSTEPSSVSPVVTKKATVEKSVVRRTGTVSEPTVPAQKVKSVSMDEAGKEGVFISLTDMIQYVETLSSTSGKEAYWFKPGSKKATLTMENVERLSAFLSATSTTSSGRRSATMNDIVNHLLDLLFTTSPTVYQKQLSIYRSQQRAALERQRAALDSELKKLQEER